MMVTMLHYIGSFIFVLQARARAPQIKTKSDIKG